MLRLSQTKVTDGLLLAAVCASADSLSADFGAVSCVAGSVYRRRQFPDGCLSVVVSHGGICFLLVYPGIGGFLSDISCDLLLAEYRKCPWTAADPGDEDTADLSCAFCVFTDCDEGIS